MGIGLQKGVVGYAPIRSQLCVLFRAVNRQRKAAELELVPNGADALTAGRNLAERFSPILHLDSPPNFRPASVTYFVEHSYNRFQSLYFVQTPFQATDSVSLQSEDLIDHLFLSFGKSNCLNGRG
jgi:hypothetical protein